MSVKGNYTILLNYVTRKWDVMRYDHLCGQHEFVSDHLSTAEADKARDDLIAADALAARKRGFCEMQRSFAI